MIDYINLTRQFVKEYQEKFALQEWQIVYKFHEDEIPGAEGSVAAITGNGPYRHAILDVALNEVRNKGHLKRTIKHELLHLFHVDYDRHLQRVLKHIELGNQDLADQYWNLSRDIIERLVTKLERLIK